MEREELKSLIKKIVADTINGAETEIPIGVSNRHIHLTESDYNQLFPNEPIQVKKWLKQPGEFAAEQTLTVVSGKGELKSVRILGPLRKFSQVELSKTDVRMLGLQIPIRISGDIEGTPGIKLVSKTRELTLPKGVIVAKRHIHLPENVAAEYGVKQGDEVSVEVGSELRSLILHHCTIRVNNQFIPEMHIDTDEANAADIAGNAFAKIIKP
ncbi:phosphate propanoyltransferase [Listeria seeligeri]|uniref:phosphate propanoyltransferase n=1 Tax=Listeria seeligeri TaxID=1640 RepID=UPI00162A355F|nr:phosphate propanoyltransferase [Listeria seeligeri]MBC1884540.1 phosphate propanoyltransferase [Listeria seeligeri]MBC1988672.1 phosphate propanoyltransferase [Listeria seeligeri]